MRGEGAIGLLQEASEGAAGTTNADGHHHEAVETLAPQTKRKTRATRKRANPKRPASGNQRSKRSKAIASDKP